MNTSEKSIKLQYKRKGNLIECVTESNKVAFSDAQTLHCFLFLNGKLKLESTFWQIAYSDSTSMQKHCILDNGKS